MFSITHTTTYTQANLPNTGVFAPKLIVIYSPAPQHLPLFVASTYAPPGQRVAGLRSNGNRTPHLASYLQWHTQARIDVLSIRGDLGEAKKSIISTLQPLWNISPDEPWPQAASQTEGAKLTGEKPKNADIIRIE